MEPQAPPNDYTDFQEFVDDYGFTPASGDPSNALDYATNAEVAEILGDLLEVRCYDHLRPLSHIHIPRRCLKDPPIIQRSHGEISTILENTCLTTSIMFNLIRRWGAPNSSLPSHWQPFIGHWTYVHRICWAASTCSPECRPSSRCMLAIMKKIFTEYSYISQSFAMLLIIPLRAISRLNLRHLPRVGLSFYTVLIKRLIITFYILEPNIERRVLLLRSLY